MDQNNILNSLITPIEGTDAQENAMFLSPINIFEQ